MKLNIEKIFIIGIIILCFTFLLMARVKADTVYINSENYNDTLLSELTSDSIIVINNTITIDTAFQISGKLGIYPQIIEIGKPQGLEFISYTLPLKEQLKSDNINFEIYIENNYTVNFEEKTIHSTKNYNFIIKEVE